MSLGDQIEAYTAVLFGLLGEPDVYVAVDALMARDSASRWWAHVQ